MTIWTSPPDAAWREHIAFAASDAGWVNDSSNIAENIRLSKRELFGLIMFAHLYGDGWSVGYDADDAEPNDGFISNGDQKIRFEHKVVVGICPAA